ncbi:NADP-dependent oxidoreductase domain [Pseudocohnilembus persalinus]|uniref:NADP-dependent oxidoreductase domain n=1 Tax=Pseudocohnilembus persalinus TaxID=266149 RepID=A0A0V0QMS9_PSEPJ|nr:NADP-dependent oxidoreductase domain [Pseudocohnilembus persalinus]|eukprot:KRX03253.1 NADP-dependent oxidoreductase domain [Pseudocohnilembus persalinus]
MLSLKKIINISIKQQKQFNQAIFKSGQQFCTKQENNENQEKKQAEYSDSDADVDEEQNDVYYKLRSDDLQQYYHGSGYTEKERLDGYATPEGTKKYAQINPLVSKDHFKTPYGSDLKISSLGIGSYRNSFEEIERLVVFNSYIESVLTGGVNYLDTSINSSGMSSERVLGAVLRYLQDNNQITRDQLFISTKHGKFTEDFDSGTSGTKYIGKLLKSEQIKESDVFERKCYHPTFLEHQFKHSLQNIGVNTLDLVYINEPIAQTPEKFYDAMANAFEFYENKVQQNQLRYYGVDSWQGFRSLQDDYFIHIEIGKLVEMAEKIAGKNNSFKFINFPLSHIMPDALTEKQQTLKLSEEKQINTTIFEIADYYKININTKSPLAGGAALNEELPENVFPYEKNTDRHIQFARSTPSNAYISCIMGTGRQINLLHKLQLIEQDLIPQESMYKFYKKDKIKVGNLNFVQQQYDDQKE